MKDAERAAVLGDNASGVFRDCVPWVATIDADDASAKAATLPSIPGALVTEAFE